MFKTLTIGMKGPEVSVLQARLNASGPSELALLSIDGSFWAKTDRRVKEYQRRNGLASDGIVGPKTWGKLLADLPVASSLSCDPCCDNANPDHLNSVNNAATFADADISSNASSSAKPNVLLGFSIPIPKLPSLPKLPSMPKLRPLAGSPEEALMIKAYGTSIDSSTVFMSDKTGLGGRPFTIASPAAPLIKPRQIMNVGLSPGNCTIVHELAHVWQSQHAVNPMQYMANSVESQGLAEAANFTLRVKSFDSYGYRPMKKFSEYAAEQIAQQAMNGEVPILLHMRSIPAWRVDPENVTSLATPRIEDTSVPGVKLRVSCPW